MRCSNVSRALEKSWLRSEEHPHNVLVLTCALAACPFDLSRLQVSWGGWPYQSVGPSTFVCQQERRTQTLEHLCANARHARRVSNSEDPRARTGPHHPSTRDSERRMKSPQGAGWGGFLDIHKYNCFFCVFSCPFSPGNGRVPVPVNGVSPKYTHRCICSVCGI